MHVLYLNCICMINTEMRNSFVLILIHLYGKWWHCTLILDIIDFWWTVHLLKPIVSGVWSALLMSYDQVKLTMSKTLNEHNNLGIIVFRTHFCIVICNLVVFIYDNDTYFKLVKRYLKTYDKRHPHTRFGIISALDGICLLLLFY